MSERCQCGITVGELMNGFSPDEGINPTYDLALEFADDETLAVYLVHHDEAKVVRRDLQLLARGIDLVRQRTIDHEEVKND